MPFTLAERPLVRAYTLLLADPDLLLADPDDEDERARLRQEAVATVREFLRRFHEGESSMP